MKYYIFLPVRGKDKTSSPKGHLIVRSSFSLSSLSLCWTQFMAGFDRKRSKASSCQKVPWCTRHKANGRRSSLPAFNLATDPFTGPHLELRPSLTPNQAKYYLLLQFLLKINKQKRASRLSKSLQVKISSLIAM